MFDYIECEHKLPLPDFTEGEAEDLKEIKWEEIEFQTKSLHDLLTTYTISEDGQIYENKETDGIEKIEHSGEIIFYSLVLGGEWDHWLEFNALFWKGDLKEINLVEYKKEGNAKRLEAQKQFDVVLKDFGAKQKKWWFPLYKFYREILGLILGTIRWLVSFVAKLTWKIERWLP